MHDGVIQLTRAVFARKYNIVRKSLKGKQNNKPSPDKQNEQFPVCMRGGKKRENQ